MFTLTHFFEGNVHAHISKKGNGGCIIIDVVEFSEMYALVEFDQVGKIKPMVGRRGVRGRKVLHASEKPWSRYSLELRKFERLS